MPAPIPFLAFGPQHDPIRDEVLAALAAVYDSQWYVLGEAVRGFEAEYRSAIAAVLAEATLEVPADQRPILGGRRGHHSEHLGHLLAVMQHIPRLYPDAKW